eukprot:m.246143 g.246143  ORF g.246143 m.246143 type:complete len:110 (+) comp17151_c1_seq24:2041-2370(+)
MVSSYQLGPVRGIGDEQVPVSISQVPGSWQTSEAVQVTPPQRSTNYSTIDPLIKQTKQLNKYLETFVTHTFDTGLCGIASIAFFAFTGVSSWCVAACFTFLCAQITSIT